MYSASQNFSAVNNPVIPCPNFRPAKKPIETLISADPYKGEGCGHAEQPWIPTYLCVKRPTFSDIS